MVLVMSVFPGFAGQAFKPEVLEGVRVLRSELDYQGEIEVDGLTIGEAQEKLRMMYINERILREEKAQPILTLIKAIELKNYEPKSDLDE